MTTPQRSPSGPSGRARLAAVAATVVVLASACTAATPSSSVDPNGSPQASRSVDLSPSAPASGDIDPSPSPSPTDEPSASAAPTSSTTPWRPAGTLIQVPEWPLSDYHAVLAGAGRVLLVGPRSAEVWEPATNAWRSTTPLDKPRHEFAAVTLADGRVLVTGGVNEEVRGGGEAAQSFSSTYVFDPRSGAEDWTKVGLLHQARTAPSIARLPDGRVLVAGGYFYTGSMEGRASEPGITLAAYRPGSAGTSPGPGPLDDVDVPPWGYALATAELFDPATGTWSTTGAMRYARAGAEAVTLGDGRILIVGSSPENVTGIPADAFCTAEIYDPATGRFVLAGRFPDIDLAAIAELGVALPDGDPAAGPNGELVALADGGALLIGHLGWWKHQAEIVRDLRFDVATTTWTEVGQSHAWAFDDAHETSQSTPGSGRVSAQVATLADGRVLVAGGADGYQYTGEVAASAELYDPTTQAWKALAAMPTPREGGAAVLLGDGSVLLVGGAGGWDASGSRTPLKDVIRLVPEP